MQESLVNPVPCKEVMPNGDIEEFAGRVVGGGDVGSAPEVKRVSILRALQLSVELDKFQGGASASKMQVTDVDDYGMAA